MIERREQMQLETGSTSRIRRFVGNGLITLVALLLLASASAKFAQVPRVENELGADGFSPAKVMFIAFLEASSAALLLIPVTRSAGFLLVASFFGGAIATHLQHAKSIAGPSVILLVIWLAAWLRHPETFWSWGQRRKGHKSLAGTAPA
jgi:hypothetical protein